MAFSAVLTGTGVSTTLTNNSNAFTLAAADAGILVGSDVSATGLAAGTKVATISGTTGTFTNVYTGTTGAVSVIYGSKYGSTLTISLSGATDYATPANILSAGFGSSIGTRHIYFTGGLTVQYSNIVAGAVFDFLDWYHETGVYGRVQFEQTTMLGELRGGYLVNGTQFIKTDGPTFAYSLWGNGVPGGSSLFAGSNTGAVTGTFRMHNPRFVERQGSNMGPSFNCGRFNCVVENMVMDFQVDGAGVNAGIAFSYGTLKNTYLIKTNGSYGSVNGSIYGTLDGLIYTGNYQSSPQHKFSIPNGTTLDRYTPQVTSSQYLGGGAANGIQGYSNPDLSSAGWGLSDLLTKYLLYSGWSVLNWSRLVSLSFKDSANNAVTGVTLYIKGKTSDVLNAVQLGDYSANTIALTQRWNAPYFVYRVNESYIDNITQTAQIRKYGFFQQISPTYSLNLNTYSQTFFLLPDTSIAGISEATAAALTSISIDWDGKAISVVANANYDQVSARVSYELALTTGSKYADPRTISSVNSILSSGWTINVMPGVTLGSGANITYVYADKVQLLNAVDIPSLFSAGGVLQPSGKLLSVTVLGNQSNYSGVGNITALYESLLGKSTIIEQSGVTAGSSIYVGNNATGVTKQFASNTSSSTYRTYFAPNETADQLVVRELFGFQRVAQIVPLTGGLIKISYVDIPDIGITQANAATVAAYTQLETNSKLKDYVSLKRLEEQYIKIGEIAVRDGTSINFGSYSGKVKSTATVLFNLVGNLITIKANGLAGDSKYTTIVATPPATWTADTTESLTTNIEDGGGDSSVNITASGVSTFEIWKITDATNPDDYATGILLATVGVGKFRFLHADGYKMVIRDTTTNFRVVSEMEKGIYEAALFFGAAVQLAQAAEVTQINTKVDTLQVEVGNIMQNFDVSHDSLHAISQSVDGLPTLSEIESSTVLAKESVLDAAKAKIDTMVDDVWSATSRTLTSAGSSGATLAEIEASTVLAKEATLSNLPTAAETASAVRTELATELAHLDANVSSRSTLTVGDIPAGLTAEQVWTATTRTLTESAGLTPAQADQLDALPTLAEIEASTVLAKESTLQAIKQLIANRYPSNTTTNIDISDMDSMVLATFAEPFILQSTTGNITLQGVFDDRDSQDPVKTAMYGDRVYILTISAETFAANDIAIYSTVIVREISYQVIDTHYDVANVMALILRKY